MIFVSRSNIRRSVLISLSVSTAMAGLFSLPSFAKVTDWDKQLSSGYNQLGLGNTEKALDFFRKQSAKNPESGACHLGVGKCLKRLMKISEAKQEFKLATQVEPTLPDAWYELGVVSEGDQEWDNAITAFKKFLELKPDAAMRQTVDDRIRFCEGKKPNT